MFQSVFLHYIYLGLLFFALRRSGQKHKPFLTKSKHKQTDEQQSRNKLPFSKTFECINSEPHISVVQLFVRPNASLLQSWLDRGSVYTKISIVCCFPFREPLQ